MHDVFVYGGVDQYSFGPQRSSVFFNAGAKRRGELAWWPRSLLLGPHSLA